MRGRLHDAERAPGPATGLIVAITLAGLLLRLPGLGNSLFGDELSSYFIAGHDSLGGVLRILHGHSVDLNPPLYFTLAWLAERAGHSPELLRLPSLLAGTATIALTYRVGLRTVGRASAITAAAVIALSPFMIYYSTEARPYALVTTLALASTLALLKAIESSRRWWWIAYAALSCATVYTHDTGLFVLVAQFAWALAYHRPAAPALIVANLAAAAVFTPWLPALIDNTRSPGTQVFALLEPFDLSDVSRDLAHWAIGHPYLQLSAVPGPAAIALLLAATALAVAAALASALGAARPTRSPAALPSSGTVLTVMLALAAPLEMVLYSELRTSVWDLRNLAVSSPGLALVLGSLLTHSPLRLVAPATVGLAAAGLAIGSTDLLTVSRQRPDYAAAAALVIRSGSAGDPVAVVPAPTPGPLSAMDAALARAGDGGRGLLRIGAPPLSAVLHAVPYAPLPPTPPSTLATQSAALPGGRLFVITPGTPSLSTLLGPGTVNVPAALGPFFGTGRNGQLLGTVYAPLSAYLKAVLRHFRPLFTRTFPGFLRLTVYVFVRR